MWHPRTPKNPHHVNPPASHLSSSSRKVIIDDIWDDPGARAYPGAAACWSATRVVWPLPKYRAIYCRCSVHCVFHRMGFRLILCGSASHSSSSSCKLIVDEILDDPGARVCWSATLALWFLPKDKAIYVLCPFSLPEDVVLMIYPLRR